MGLGPIEKTSRLKNGPRFWVRADSFVKALSFLPMYVEFSCGDTYKMHLPLKVSNGGRVEYRRMEFKGALRAFDEQYGLQKAWRESEKKYQHLYLNGESGHQEKNNEAVA